MMHVLYLNYHLSGGAAIAATRLYDSLPKDQVNGTFSFIEGEPPDETYREIVSNERFSREIGNRLRRTLLRKKVKYYLKRRPGKYEIFTYPCLHFKTDYSILNSNPDILHLHWVAGFMDYPSFFSSLPESMPIVWTLHDMNPFTGGCHHSDDCEKYTRQCEECPQIGHSSPGDLSAQGFQIKLDALKDKNLHVVAVSRWLQEQAERSAIFSSAKSFQTVHLGLDVNQFKPFSREESRRNFGIKTDNTVLLFGANKVDNWRKGYSFLVEALNIIKLQGELTLVVFGGETTKLSLPDNVEMMNVGYVGSPEKLAELYSAADLFIMPSICESFPQTCLEAMACGVPVVAFKAGGIPEIICSGETGLLAETKNSHDLAEKIQWMINHPDERQKMGNNARYHMEQNFTLKQQTDKYMSLYGAMLT